MSRGGGRGVYFTPDFPWIPSCATPQLSHAQLRLHHSYGSYSNTLRTFCMQQFLVPPPLPLYGDAASTTIGSSLPRTAI